MPQNTLLMKYLKKIKLFLFFLLLCLILFFVLFFFNQFFLVKKIEIISEKKFLLANQNELLNKNLIFINKNKIAKKIIKENSLLKDVVVSKTWPNSIKLYVFFYDPVAALTVNNGFFYLSVDGRIISKTKNNQLSSPIINYYQRLNNNFFQIGDWIDYSDIRQTLFYIDKLGQINLRILTIDIKGQDMLVFNLEDDKKIVFSSNKEKETQIYQLELIIRQFKIEGKEFKKIDLRFEKPVITF